MIVFKVNEFFYYEKNSFCLYKCLIERTFYDSVLLDLMIFLLNIDFIT